MRRDLQLQPLATVGITRVLKGVPFLVSTVVEAANAGRLASSKTANGSKPFDAFAAPDQESLTADFGSHKLILNKFPVVPHHLVLFTSAFQPQSDALNHVDFAALWKCVRELDALAFYNCGDNSGASQPRKHMQVIPRAKLAATYPAGTSFAVPPVEGLVLEEWCRRGTVIARSPFQVKTLPFPHAVCTLGRDVVAVSDERAAELLHQAYTALLGSCGLQVRVPVKSHNLLLTSTWMLVVPRFRGEALGCNINSVAYAGLMLLKPTVIVEPADVLIACATP